VAAIDLLLYFLCSTCYAPPCRPSCSVQTAPSNQHEALRLQHRQDDILHLIQSISGTSRAPAPVFKLLRPCPCRLPLPWQHHRCNRTSSPVMLSLYCTCSRAASVLASPSAASRKYLPPNMRLCLHAHTVLQLRRCSVGSGQRVNARHQHPDARHLAGIHGGLLSPSLSLSLLPVFCT